VGSPGLADLNHADLHIAWNEATTNRAVAKLLALLLGPGQAAGGPAEG
jgi:hypothetical protein